MNKEDHPFVKFPCIECKHCKLPWYESLMNFLFRDVPHDSTYICHKKVTYLSDPTPVHGLKEKKFNIKRNCYEERNARGEHSCGEEGKFWEPKNKHGLFKLLQR